MGTIDELVNSVRGRVLKHRLLRNLVVLSLVTTAVITAVLLVGGYKTVAEVSQRAIAQASERTESELKRFFEPVETQLSVIAAWGESGELQVSYEEIEALNRHFQPIIEANPQVTSVLLADSAGREYLLLREGEGWLNRYIDEAYSQGSARWIRRNGEGEELERWEGEHDYQMRQRPWYAGAISSSSDGIFWTAPYTFFTTKEPGVTASRRFEDPETGRAKVVAFDVLLTDISAFTTRVQPTENGFITVLSAGGEVIGLPHRQTYEDPEAVRRDVLSTWSELELTTLGEAWRQWQEEGRGEAVIEGKSRDVGDFRAGFQQFELGERTLTVATVVPARDLTGVIKSQRNIMLGVMGIALFLAVVVGFRTSREYEERFDAIADAARNLGQYRLEGKVGAGGMGEIYRAHHGMLQRPTAVKLLKSELYDEESIKRFEREVRLSCKLKHPNTVTIFDYGKTDEGVFYYAMELIDGVNLTEFLDYTGPLSDGRVIYLIDQICGSLAEAHEAGLIHRDIKPGNIMVGNFGGLADRITVLDFGLVKDIHRPDKLQLTNQEYIQGSPGYMAPEVILGEFSDTPAVDIFALGAVAFHLLCGEEPFVGDSAVKVMLAQVNDTPRKPSQVLGRPVDEDLEALVLQCMEKRAEDRPGSVADLRRRLRQCKAAGTWGEEDARAWWEEHGDDVIVQSPAPKEEGTEALQVTLSLMREERPEEERPTRKAKGTASADMQS